MNSIQIWFMDMGVPNLILLPMTYDNNHSNNRYKHFTNHRNRRTVKSPSGTKLPYLQLCFQNTEIKTDDWF